MFIPMLFMQIGIYRDYWGDFLDNAWSVHIHYWTGTVWYIYLIIQPYFATHGQIARHRTNGIIGMFIAGAVCFTALSMMHRDIVTSWEGSSSTGAVWTLSTMVLLWCGCGGDCNDDSVWLCDHTKYYL
jgi:hypothetical protein